VKTPTSIAASSNKYDYDCPTEHEALKSLVKLVGQDEAERLWSDACASFGALRPGPELTFDELFQVAEWLQQQSGMAKIVGNSMTIRLRSYHGVKNR
jgi:hypothetical protein